MPKTDPKTIMAYQTAFDSPQGMEVLKDLAQRCFEDNTTIVCSDPHTSAFNEGRRSVILIIRRLLAANPNKGIDL